MTLKELLNELIRKGWKPRGKIEMEFMYMLGDKEHPIYTLFFKWGASGVISAIEQHHIRELVSKESGLWQFVCEMSVYNNYNKEKGKVLTWKKFEDDKYQINGYSNGGGYIQDYEYRIIESSLKDESELEQFLLDNIKVE